MKKPERILHVANNSGTIYQRNIYETKTATTLINRTEEVSPLPCLQRSRLCEVREFVARQPGCDVSYKTQFKNLQKYFLINGQPMTKVQYSYESLVIAGQARILQNRMLPAGQLRNVNL